MIRVFQYDAVSEAEIFARTMPETDVCGIVSEIIATVKKEGDRALYTYCKKFDKAELAALEVTKEEIDKAMAAVEPRFLEVLEKAAKNIYAFHEKQKRTSFILNEANGVITGQKIIPIDKAGIYVPGGTASYPSTVLMDSIPAKIAGCKEIIMVSPPNEKGEIAPVILAAAKIAGVDRIFKVGGAQAIAALAYGTESIPRVDKIVGPGNAFVAEAKKQVYGDVSIDMIAGPSEILIIADEKSNPAHIAADMLSQAEHDKMASAVLITTSASMAEAVQKELEVQIPRLSRSEIARASIDKNGKIIVVDTIEKAIEVSNDLAPEHLEVCVENPFDFLDRIRHAGSVFLGRNCPEALGDYMAGPNHTLPTSGSARFSSPLSVDDFVKKMQYTYYTKDALSAIGNDIIYFAEKEGLGAHAESVRVRTEEEI